MSFLWHGLTEEGAQVPVQVDAEGRVIAVDGTPGTNYWARTGTTLSPVNTGDSVDISVSGGYNLTLNKGTGAVIGFDTSDASGGASIGYATAGRDLEFRISASSPNPTFIISDNQITRFSKASSFGIAVLLTEDDGTTKIGGTLPSAANISLNADGSATYLGNITAPNVTFRSSDPRFYVKKTKNKDAQPEYVGPELDLLAEIARLEGLVRHLYETLRMTPPAGWPVWDGADDVLRQLRK